ncbi:MAG: recombinase XerC [Pseudooceanicola sp.]|nr:recombinase XerC [Pseudooceanicola sp.]
MSSNPNIDESLRAKIIAEPAAILDDRDLMHALIAANDREIGANVVDLRGIAMERLEARLDRLEDTHRSVIAAAYENLAGTNQVHRAVLRMLDPMDFEAFLSDLDGEVADTLGVDHMHLVLETVQTDDDPTVGKLGTVLKVVRPGFCNEYADGGRGAPPRQVTLRQVQSGSLAVYGEMAQYVRSEACLRLNFGRGRLPGMLVMGSEDPHQFTPQHGTDLLGFFAGVFERTMRRWLD